MISTLLDLSAENIALNCDLIHSVALLDSLDSLPEHLKDRIRAFLLKRRRNRILNGRLLKSLLHKYVSVLDLSETAEISGCHIQVAAEKCPNLVRINVNNCDLRDLSPGFLGQLKKLQAVHLNNGKVSKELLIEMAESCPGLIELNLGGCGNVVDDETVSILSRKCSKLTSLNLSKTFCGDKCLKELPISLRELRIDGCNAISDSGIEGLLRRCRLLTILIFHNCPKITDRSRAVLEAFQEESHSRMQQVTWTVY